MLLLVNYALIVKEPALVGLALIGLVIGACLWLFGKRMERDER